MLCIHGLDKNNCPTCRIIRSTMPINSISKIEINDNKLDPFNPFFDQNLASKKEFRKDLFSNQNKIQPDLIQNIPEPNLIGTIPNFENKLFLERLDDLKTKRKDMQKVNLDNLELNLEEE